jgi:hypothetical protein
VIDLEDAIDQLADETAFSGVVRVDRDGTVELAKADAPRCVDDSIH